MVQPSRSRLEFEIVETLPAGMELPDSLALLFEWIETNGFFVDARGQRFGCLSAPADQRSAVPGTGITFQAEGNKYLGAWFGHETTEIMKRLSVFAKTGADGSTAASGSTTTDASASSTWVQVRARR